MLTSEAEWRAASDGFECGESRIQPFLTRLENVAVANGSRILVLVRERSAGRSGAELAEGVSLGRLTPVDPARFDRLARDLREWPLQWQMLVVNAVSKSESRKAEGVLATLEAGPWGTAPVFLVAEAGNLWGDWDAARLLHLLTWKSIDPVRAARYLTEYATPYARSTIFWAAAFDRAFAGGVGWAGRQREADDHLPGTVVSSARG